MQSESIKELATALAKAQGQMKPATKSADNPYFKSKYADLPAVWEAARKALADNGLSVVQSTDCEGDAMYIVTMLCHSSGEWIKGRYPVKPIKADPQSVGSAITYARRYAFCAIVGVTAEDEDDDGNLASGKQETATSRNKRYNKLKAELMECDDPALFWHENKGDINEFKVTLGQEYYDQLVTVAADRKKALAEKEAMQAGMPPGFNEVR